MLRSILSLSTCIAMTFGLSACNMSADDKAETSTAAIEAPAHATSREDVEKIVRAYLLENPEVIVEAMAVLEEREQAKTSEILASDKRDPSIGPADAPVTIVEFFDYKCGYCKRSVDWVMDLAEESDGKIRVVFKEFPILSEQSKDAALAALAAQQQDKYMEFHQKLMKYPGELSRDNIFKLAGDVGLNTAKLEKVMDDPKTMEHLLDIRLEAQTYGADATPSFFINGELIQGFDKPKLEARIKALAEG